MLTQSLSEPSKKEIWKLFSDSKYFISAFDWLHIFLFAISIQRLRIVKLFSSFIKLTNIAFSQRFPVKFPDDLTENASVESVEYDDYDNRKKDVSSIRYELLLDPEVETSVYKQYSQKKDDSHKHHFFGGRKTSKRRTKKI